MALRGNVVINGKAVHEAQFVLLERAGRRVSMDASTDAVILLLSGEPLDEPIFGYGPFVMNSQQEIAQAMADFNSGRFGQIPH